jgi:hypothetical protein
MVEPTQKRPTLEDKAVLENIAAKIFPEVKQWLENAGQVFTDIDEQGLFDVLVEVIHHHLPEWNGYAMAKELEGDGWSPDADLVAILNECSAYAIGALRIEIIRWVKTNGLVPLFTVGDLVWVAIKGEPSMEGSVAEVQPETLEYIVQVGHSALLISQEGIVSHGGGE